jgi:RNA polymerase sigma-70 factor, ECF subfamily
MDEHKFLAEEFEAHRGHLRGVAYRMLGAQSEAEDAVQEAWLRLSRADATAVRNLGGWLTTVVARVCLDTLRARKARREEAFAGDLAEPIASDEDGPNREMDLADSIGLAMLVVLETLSPAERVAFVLHDMFDLPFDEIAPIVGRSTAAARQLASRARRRVQGGTVPDADRARQSEVVEAFLAASREGNFDALLAVLDPDVVLRADPIAVAASEARREQGAPVLAPEVRGAAAVARTFSGRAQAARLALVDGAVGLVWAPGGTPRAAFGFTIANGRVVAIDMVADPERLGRLNVAPFD